VILPGPPWLLVPVGAVGLIVMATLLVSRLIGFLVVIFLEVSLLGVIPVVREIIFPIALTLLVILVFRIILIASLVMSLIAVLVLR
jgi:hypothetical protein